MQKAIRWPCGVCGRGVGNSVIVCTCMRACMHVLVVRSGYTGNVVA